MKVKGFLAEPCKCLACPPPFPNPVLSRTKDAITLIPLLLALPAFAADYYVSTAGTDAPNRGTSAQPWRTINYAIAGRSPGDTVHVAAGQTFSENVYFGSGGGSGGSPGNPVTVMCDDPANRATIRQASAGSDGVSIYNTGYITLRNLVITDLGTNITTKSGVSAYADNGQYAGLTFSNLTVSGFYRGVVIGGWGAATCGFNTILIQDCQANYNRDLGGMTYAQTVGGISNIIVRGCQFNYNYGDPNTTKNTGSGFVFAETVDGLMDRCIAHDNGGAGTANEGPVGLWAYDSRRITIQFCESYRNQAQHQDGDGFDLDLGTSDSVIQYCYSHDNYGAGYLLSTDGNLATWSNNVVRYCISENDGTGGKLGALHLYSPGTVAPLKNSQIYGNTIYSRVAPAVRFYDFANMSGIRLRNNLFVTSNNWPLIFCELPAASPATNQASFQGNDYWPSGGAFQIQKGANTYYTSLSAWQNSTCGQEKVNGSPVGYNLDPRLVNAGGGGTIGNAYALTSLLAYQLQPASPLINAGLDLPVSFGLNPGASDFYGAPIPQMGSYDIGAAEFVLRPTTTVLTNPVNPSSYGGSVALTATLKTNGVRATGATGNYVFKVDGTAAATNAVSGGSVAYITSGLTAGPHTITAEYAGDPVYAPSTNAVTQTINKQTPNLTAPTATAITYGQALSASTLQGGAATNANNHAAVSGGFAFATPSVLLPAGTTNASVTFTPSDTANYNAGTTTVSVMVLARPSVTGGVRLPAGSFQLTFRGVEGQPFRVLATNLPTAPLATWPVLTNGVFGVGGSATFTDPNATVNDNQRYYRIGSP